MPSAASNSSIFRWTQGHSSPAHLHIRMHIPASSSCRDLQCPSLNPAQQLHNIGSMDAEKDPVMDVPVQLLQQFGGSSTPYASSGTPEPPSLPGRSMTSCRALSHARRHQTETPRNPRQWKQPLYSAQPAPLERRPVKVIKFKLREWNIWGYFSERSSLMPNLNSYT